MNLEKKLNLKAKNLIELQEDLERHATSSAPLEIREEAIRLTKLEIELRVSNMKALKSFEDSKPDNIDFT